MCTHTRDSPRPTPLILTTALQRSWYQPPRATARATEAEEPRDLGSTVSFNQQPVSSQKLTQVLKWENTARRQVSQEKKAFGANELKLYPQALPKNMEFMVRSLRSASFCQSVVNSTSACLPSVATSILSVVISKFSS